jgi:RimJ/RimL family protein N-acetyltransferase
MLWVLTANTAARAFYEWVGFRADGAIRILDIDPGAEETRYRVTAPTES